MATAKQILLDAEDLDAYRASCAASVPNALARQNHQYLPYFLPPKDADRLRSKVFQTQLLNGCDVVVLHSSADNGYPHTRPTAVICLPDSFVTSSTDAQLTETLAHEAMHVHQRRYPELWKTKCKQEGWTPIPTGSIPKRFRDQCRLNPDTFYDTPFWAWDTHHVPLPMFTSMQPTGLADVRIEWLDLRTGALFHDAPKSFTTKYGNPSQPEHPYEIYAIKYAAQGITTQNALYLKLINPE